MSQVRKSYNEKMLQASELLHIKERHISDLEIVVKIRQGIPASSVAFLSKETHIPQQEMLNLLGLSSRTIHRRISLHKKLKPEEAEKLFRLARVFACAVNVFENKQDALEWLNAPKVALRNQTPMSLLDTEIGAREVEKLLGRIEYGVYS